MDPTEQKKKLESFLKRKQVTVDNFDPSIDKAFDNTITNLATSIKNIDKQTLDELTGFVISLLKNKNEYNKNFKQNIWAKCYDTNKFTIFIPCKCGSRSFSKYFSILNNDGVITEEKYFSTKKDIIIVLRDPVSRFYSGLLTTFRIITNPSIFEEQEKSISDILQHHTLGYHTITPMVKKYTKEHDKLENLYRISFSEINSYTHEICEGVSNDIQTIASLDYLKTIIQPQDLYEKDIWHNEVYSYEYLLSNSKEYDFDKWKILV